MVSENVQKVYDEITHLVYWNDDNNEAKHVKLHMPDCNYPGQHNASNANTDRNGYILFTREKEARFVMALLASHIGTDNVGDCKCMKKQQ